MIPEELSDQTQAILTIHCTISYPVHVVRELCWTTTFGAGCFLTDGPDCQLVVSLKGAADLSDTL